MPTWSGLLAVIALAVAARLAAQVTLGFYDGPEVFEEDLVARNVLAGRGYMYELFGTEYRAYGRPLYTLVLLALYLPFGINSVVVGLVQSLFGGALALTTRWIGARIGGPVVGAIAGVAVALHPGLVVYAAKVHPLNMDALIATAAFAAVLSLRERPRLISATRLGLIAAAASLARQTFLPFMAIAAAVTVARAPGRTALLALVLVPSLIVTGAWIARNALVTGTATISSSTGYLLWIGNSPVASGGTVTAAGRDVLDDAPEMLRAVWGRDEHEQDRIFRQAAVWYISEDPMRTLRAFASKFVDFWAYNPRLGALYPPLWRDLYRIYYAGIAVLALIGAAAMWRTHRWELTMLGVAFVSVSAAQSVFYVDGRHRWELEALVLVIAAVGSVALARALLSGVPPRRAA